jgi:hypothetical protein
MLLVGHWSHLAAGAPIVVSFGAATFAVLRDRTGTGQYAISTDCEEHDVLLLERFGAAERKCRNCGHSQSWATH